MNQLGFFLVTLKGHCTFAYLKTKQNPHLLTSRYLLCFPIMPFNQIEHQNARKHFSLTAKIFIGLDRW